MRVCGSGLLALAIAGCGGASGKTEVIAEDANNAPRLQTELEYQKVATQKRAVDKKDESKKTVDFYSTKVPIPRRK